MQVYLDTSALVKLVVEEPESSALETYLGDYPTDRRLTAALTAPNWFGPLHGSSESTALHTHAACSPDCILCR